MNPVMPSPEHGDEFFIGRGQEKYYEVIPARVRRDEHWDSPRVTTEWQPTAEELAILMNGGKIRLTFLTFGSHFAPMMQEVIAKEDQ
jgi:hypothetical protein